MSHTISLIPILLGLAPALVAQESELDKVLPKDGAPGDLFGSAVDTDGARIVIGSADSAHLFDAATGAEYLELQPTGGTPTDGFGFSVALDGARVVVGAPLFDGVDSDSGAVYVFDSTTGQELLQLQAANGVGGGQFGYAVASDGGVIVVGALGAAYLFDSTTGQEIEELVPVGGATTLGLSGFGEAVAIDGGRVVVGARLEDGVSGIAGAAYVYDVVSGNQLHRLVASNGTAWAFFGACVAIHGEVIAIGAPEAGPLGKHSGRAYLFDAVTGQQTHDIFPSDGHVFAKFGSSVAVRGEDVFVGSDQNSPAGLFSAGSVYLYDAQSGSQVGKLVASDVAPLDEFGAAVAAAGGVLVIGSPRDDDLGDSSGSAYVFGSGGSGPTVYCTGKASSGGCVAQIGTSSTADPTSGASDYSVTASSIQGFKNGILFGGNSGPAALPFSGGTLCVNPPTKRSPVQGSGGSSPISCDGTYGLTVNDGMVFPAGLDAGSGNSGWYQYWYRDPNNGAGNLGTALSNAVQLDFQ